MRFRILGKTAWPEVPPRVEYTLTPFGERFAQPLDGIDALEAELQRNPAPRRGRAPAP